MCIRDRLFPQPFGTVRHRAEDAEPAGVGHGRHDVAAVAESADGELDAEHLGDPGSHFPDASCER